MYYGIKAIRGVAPAGNERTTSAVSSPRAVPLGDSVATKTEWEPASGGGQSFRGHRLVQVDHNRLEFRGTLGGKLFSLVFLVAGVSASAASIYHNAVAPLQGMRSSVGLFFFGLVFAGVGFFTFPRTIIFDRRRNLFSKGKVPILGWGSGRPRIADVPLERIYAIQVLTELIRGSKGGSYHSHELNLVLDDGKRINVIDQAGLEKLREDADTISRFLGRPVWEKQDPYG